MTRGRYADGDQIVRAGGPAEHIHLLVAGEVTVTVALDGAGVRRLATLTPGMTFGELAVLGQSTRSADVHADGPAEVLLLSAVDFARLGASCATLKARLLQNMLASACENVDRMTRVVASLGDATDAPRKTPRPRIHADIVTET